MKKNYTKQNRYLLAGLVLLAGSTKAVFADDATDIENGSPNQAVIYDSYSGAYPVISTILSQPGSFGGHTYTGWSFLASDGTGSIDMFASSSLITTYTPAVGDGISVNGYYSPYQQIPEIENSTHGPFSSALMSTGNTPASPTVTTIPAVNVNVLPFSLAGYELQLNNVTIGGSGGVGGLFPTYAQATVGTETFSVTDGSGNSMVLFDWVTSYSTDGAMGGNAVPTGPVDIDGFVDIYTPTSGLTAGIGQPEFIPTSITSLVPEPSMLNLIGVGGLMSLIARFRKKA